MSALLAAVLQVTEVHEAHPVALEVVSPVEASVVVALVVAVEAEVAVEDNMRNHRVNKRSITR